MGQPHMARHAGWLSKQTSSLFRFQGNVIPALFDAGDDTASIWFLSPTGIFAGEICLANQRRLGHVSFCSACCWHIVFLRYAKWVKSLFILPVLRPVYPDGCVSFYLTVVIINLCIVLFTERRNAVRAKLYMSNNDSTSFWCVKTSVYLVLSVDK